MAYKNLVSSLAIFFIVVYLATGAHAASLTYDFVSYIDNQGGNKNGSGGEKAILGDFSLFDTSNSRSLTITAQGTNFSSVEGSFTAFPYGYFDYGGAGIGVCQDINSSSLQCVVSSDDNLTGEPNKIEILSLAFGEDLRVDGILFRNDGHTATFGSGKSVKIATSNGMGTISASAFTSYTLEALLSSSLLGAGLLDLNPFNLASGDFLHIMYDGQQVYLSGLEVSTVPLPPSAILFGTALFGLGAFNRRRKRKALN